ncbi:hypothetical protein IW261DRAFT_1491501 [Armillaria novae-zelandiae]|uniref:MYND-type domain-containing protein n=1 Tax=Armillaria novae-zelandiae TaxID=153914 RepID=A0AA39U326_9AGAR|nr:hypothetical protein IW261DRAFT_1491501 [Armillaria novae-zelandiae]
MNTTCLVCDSPTSKKCARCKSVYYCSRAHIVQDWSSHKAYCKRVSAAGSKTFDAILFGVHETKPRLVKIPWSYGPIDEDGSSGRPWHNLDEELWFSGDYFLRTLYIQTLGAYGPPLGRTLAMLYDDNFMTNGSPINRCVQVVTQGKAVHPWGGNLLALRAPGVPSDLYDDAVVEEDLAPLIQYLADYGK